MDEHELKQYKRILKWFKGKKQAPFKIDVELHRRCNSNCLSCSRRASPDYDRLNEISKSLEMPLEKWLSIVEEAAELDVKEWHIAGGGEPMFLPEMTLPVMRRIKSRGMLGVLTTNGTLWKDEHIETIVKIGWDRIHFSIDGPNAKVNDFLRNIPGTFKRVMEVIDKFNDLKREYDTDKPMINMNTVLSRNNYQFLPEMIKLAKRKEIGFMFVDPLIVYSEIGKKLKMRKEDIEKFPKFLEKAKRLAERFGISNNFDGLECNLHAELIEKSSRMNEVVEEDMEKAAKLKVNKFLKVFLTVPCYKPWFHMTIKCDGRTTSCDVPTIGGENIKNKSLMEVWNGPYFNKLRDILISEKIPDFCAQCNPSHTTQRRKMRIEIVKMLEPNVFNEACKIYGAI
jgi:MoaA/NifB/PqqE/SkfB family radical SAM enzyme